MIQTDLDGCSAAKSVPGLQHRNVEPSCLRIRKNGSDWGQTTTPYLLRPYCVRGSLNERFNLFDLLRFQLAGEIGHAAFNVWTFEQELVEVRDHFRLGVAEVWHISAPIHTRHPMADHAVADV